MRLNSSTSLNDCIKRISDGDTGAASVLALILKENPDSVMQWMHKLDHHEIYGHDVWIGYSHVCSQNIISFLRLLGNGELKGYIDSRKSK